MSEINNLDFETRSRIAVDETDTNNAKVKVFGVGGAGGNTVNRMVKMNIEGVEYYAVNTDAKALDLSSADHKIAIGQKTTKTLGAGMKPEIGRKAAEENVEDLKEAMKGADMIFITAGMGGGTGTGASPVVGAIARELGILTVAVVTKPFGFEGKRRGQLAADGIKELRANVDTMIVVDNKKILGVVQSTDKNLTLDGAFKLTDEILGNAVRSICDIMFRHGLIHVDFADIKTVMQNGGSALMGTGIAEGEGRGVKATDLALSSPLLEDINVDGATGVLVNVSHGENFSMLEYEEAMEHIHEAVSDRNDPNIIIGDILLPELGDKVCITIIATGCGGSNKEIAQQQAATVNALRASAAAATMASPIMQTYTAPAPAAATPVQPVAAQPAQPVAAQPVVQEQPAVSARPVPATPRPTDMNFVALAHATQPLPRVFPDASTVEMPTLTSAVAESAYSQPSFDATRSAEEELVLSPVDPMTATAVAEEEIPSASETDPLGQSGILNTTGLQAPAYTRNTMSTESSSRASESQEADPFKDSGVDYSLPTWCRMNMNSDAF